MIPRDEPLAAWELWRQDDNGNRFVIGRFPSAEAAEAEQRRFEALAHKQTYWVTATTAMDADDGASSDGSGEGRGAQPADIAPAPRVETRG